MYSCERYTWFLCEHALDLNAQLSVDENQALGEQFRDDYREWRILIRLFMITFASAKLATILYNMSLLATWKRKKTLNWHDMSFPRNFKGKWLLPHPGNSSKFSAGQRRHSMRISKAALLKLIGVQAVLTIS